MTPEAQQIAIAQACGWTTHGKESGDGEVYVFYKTQEGHYRNALPDYLNDLDAIHEAEKVLTTEQAGDYYWKLKGFDAPNNTPAGNWVYHVTATQRAEAFLRTIGAWVDSENAALSGAGDDSRKPETL